MGNNSGKTLPSPAEQQAMLTALHGGAQAWNAFRASKDPNWKPVFDGMDLRGINLHQPGIKADLNDASMIGITADKTTILDNAAMNGSTIAHSNIPGLSAKGTSLNDSTIYDNNAQHLNISGSTVHDANIQKNRMESAIFENVESYRTTFAHNDLQHSAVSGLEFHHSYVEDNNFQNTTSENQSKLDTNTPVQFILSKVENNNFSHATLPGFVTEASIVTGDNEFSGTDLSGTRHNGSDLAGVSFTGAELGDDSFFHGTNLTGVKTTEAQKQAIYEPKRDRVGQENGSRQQTHGDYKIDKMQAQPLPDNLVKTPEPGMEKIPQNTPPTAATAPAGP